jgi:hypothetical protein
MNIYWRKDDKKLGIMQSNGPDHFENIIAVEEALITSKEGFNKPVLALIRGGHSSSHTKATNGSEVA